jgi:hypothetical protein
LPVLPVVAARRDDRETLKLHSSRLSRTARRTTPRADSLCLGGEAGA